MAIKGTDLIHVGGTTLIDRLQSAGPGQVNVPLTKIYELGNNLSVGVVLDIPDLSYTLTSIDASAALEAILCGTNFATDAVGTVYNFAAANPINLVAQITGGRNAASPYNVVNGVAAPFLSIESVAYKYGIQANAEQTATLKGDSIFYMPGAAYVQTASGSGVAGQTISVTNPAFPYNGDVINGIRYALAVTLTSGTRLIYGADFTESATISSVATTGPLTTGGPITAIPATITYPLPQGATVVLKSGSNTQSWVTSGPVAAGAASIPVASQTPNFAYPSGSTVTSTAWPATVTLTILAPVATTDTINVIYSSPVVSSYPQNSHTVASAQRPAAIRGRNIKVLLNGESVTQFMTDVQSFDCTWKVTLQRDLEFGSSEIVKQDFDIPDVSGSIDFMPRNPQALYQRIAQIAGAASTTEVVGALQQAVVPLEVVLYSPVDGSVLKSFQIPDARFTVPGFTGQNRQKVSVKLNFSSDSGQLTVKKGQA